MMQNETLHYPLVNGYIHNWLVAGPQAIAVEAPRPGNSPDRLTIARHYHQPEIGIEGLPVEYGDCRSGEFTDKWRYFRTGDDHLVDLSSAYPSPHYLRAWAYTEIDSPTEQDVTFVLTTGGPADLWLNDRHLYRQEEFRPQFPAQSRLSVRLEAGSNRLMIRFEEVAPGECSYSMALQIIDFQAEEGAEEQVIHIPTCAPDPQHRLKLEMLFDACHIRQDVYARKDEIIAYLLPALASTTEFNIRLQTPEGRIYAEVSRQNRIEVEQTMGAPYLSPEGSYQLRFMPPPMAFYEGNVRVTRTRDFYASTNVYATQPYGDYQARRVECMKDAARRKNNLFSEIAKMEEGWWKELNRDVIAQAIESVNQCHANAGLQLCGLLGMLYRYADKDEFPADLRREIETCVLAFTYDDDGQSSDAKTESYLILLYTCEVLAGQLFPEHTFTHTNQPGRRHLERGEQLVMEWLQERANGGFADWDSNIGFAENAVALSTLTSLAENQQIWETAALILDKMFFTLAVNSFKGIFGSTHGRCYTQHIKTGYREPTSGIARLLWGLGIFNEHPAGPVSLACSSYELPPIIAAIAADQPDELWGKEQHISEKTDSDTVNKVTYKTPDAMLCSAQDWHPGEPGHREHIWQATLSPAVTIFTSHPACLSESHLRSPNYWHGNATLPRVAQWKDMLIAIYNFADDDWMGLTHAYFPAHSMDKHRFHNNWAFGKVGDGYVALAAANGLDFQRQGDNAYRDLRSPGTPNIWLCQLGRAALDGSFDDFIEKVLALPVTFEETRVEMTTLRGDGLRFDWKGPLLLNGEPHPLDGFKHYDSPYCVCDLEAPMMEIRYGIDALRLYFEESPEEEAEQ